MLYLVAILFPPLAVLFCGKPFSALLNCILTIAFYFPGAIHAVLVVNNHNSNKRFAKLEKAMAKAAKHS